MTSSISKLLIASTMGLLAVFYCQAQTEIEALRYSQFNLAGSARTLGMNNAYGAVGADLLSTSINPAGLGIYKRSDLSITPGFYFPVNRTSYLENTATSSDFNLNLSQIGGAFTQINSSFGKVPEDGWVSYTFAVALNRTNNYNNMTLFEGENRDNSIQHYYAQNATGLSPTYIEDEVQLTEPYGLAYYAYLIDPTADTLGYTYQPAIRDTANLAVLQRRQFDTRGATNDFNFSFGANYDHKLFLGATVTIPFLRFRSTEFFSEENLNPAEPNFRSMEFSERVEENGIGIGAILGLIYQPAPGMRLGLSVRTPVRYRITTEYDYEMSASLAQSRNYHELSPIGSYQYRLTTPLRLTASGAYLFGDRGLVSIDYEYANMAQAKFSSNNYPYQWENRLIQEFYSPVQQVRVGGELRHERLYGRAGFGYASSPIQEGFRWESATGARTTFALGTGIREESFYLDVAYQLRRSGSTYQPYVLEGADVPVAEVQTSASTVLFTLGTLF